MFWSGISLGGHDNVHVFYEGTLTGLIYRDEVQENDIHLYAGAVGNFFNLMKYNARCRQFLFVEAYFEDHGLD